MTARLRELAERWRRHATSSGDARYSQCAAELLSILDAEGDGGTPLPGVVWNERTNAAHLIKRGTEVEFCAEYGCCRVFTHPARSGVVRDEEMNRCERLLTACTCHADFKDRDMVDPQCRACDLGVEVIDTFRSMRAALAHPTRDAERLKEIVRRAEKITGSRCVRFEVRFDPLSGQGLNLIDYIDAAIQGESA